MSVLPHDSRSFSQSMVNWLLLLLGVVRQKHYDGRM